MVHQIPDFDWNEQARRALLHVEAELREAHRGAMLWHISGPTVVLFETRTDEDDEFTHKQLEFIRLLLVTYGGIERSLLWNESKTTWVMIATGVSDEYGHEFGWASLEYARSALRRVSPGPLENEWLRLQGTRSRTADNQGSLFES